VEELRDRNGIGGIICGAGTESHSFLKVYSGTTSWKDVITELVTWTKDRGSLACPPLHVSVSVGGTSVQAVRESKLGFLFGNNFPDSYESFYEELVGSLRNIPVDPLGQGKNWVRDIFLRVLPTHISAVPVSLSFMCWPYRAEWIDIEA
jgi:fumarate hydratase subunit alpha